jgi:predicted secreted protein
MKNIKKDIKTIKEDIAGNNNNKAAALTYTDPQKVIMVKKTSPTFEIILASNRTTGFSWSLKNYDSDIIKAISNKYYPSKNQLIGAGGYEVWKFMIKPQGFVVPHSSNITLIYARPWDLQGAQATNFKVVTLP